MPTTTTLQRSRPFGREAARAGTTPTSRCERRPRAADQPILSIRGTVPTADAAAFVAHALRDIRAFMQEHHVATAGPPFSHCRPRGDAVDIEAGWPTSRPVAGTSRIHTGALPRSLLHRGADRGRRDGAVVDPDCALRPRLPTADGNA